MVQLPSKKKTASSASDKTPAPTKQKTAAPPAKKSPAINASVRGEVIGLTDIKDLFGLMKANDIAELKLEQHGTKIHILSSHAPVQQQQILAGMQPMMSMSAPSAASVQAGVPAVEVTTSASAPSAANAPAEDPNALPANAKYLYSPMVGTFYRSPAPDADAFVNVGDRVTEDTTLCIIEAMKLMNEIKSEMRGKILKALVENGQPVEYNQPLFLIETE